MRTAIALLAALTLLGGIAPTTAAAQSRRHTERLVARARRGDRLASAQLVEAHMGLVRSVASHYQGLGLASDDLVQEGAIGLLSAVDSYEPERGATFSTYAHWRIRAAVTHALTARGSLVRVPRPVVESGQRVVPLSLDAPLADGTPLSDRLADDPSSRPDVRAQRKLDAREVRAAVRRLGSREQLIVSRHFGIGREPETLDEIAADLHLSPARTRALEDGALQKLASALAGAV